MELLIISNVWIESAFERHWMALVHGFPWRSRLRRGMLDTDTRIRDEQEEQTQEWKCDEHGVERWDAAWGDSGMVCQIWIRRMVWL